MNMIKKGDYISLSELLENSPLLNTGVIADNQLRQLKNIFIIIRYNRFTFGNPGQA